MFLYYITSETFQKTKRGIWNAEAHLQDSVPLLFDWFRSLTNADRPSHLPCSVHGHVAPVRQDVAERSRYLLVYLRGPCWTMATRTSTNPVKKYARTMENQRSKQEGGIYAGEGGSKRYSITASESSIRWIFNCWVHFDANAGRKYAVNNWFAHSLPLLLMSFLLFHVSSKAICWKKKKTLIRPQF